MSAPICPYCGDGMGSIGTLNHIECATKLLAEVERLKCDLAHSDEDIIKQVFISKEFRQRAEAAEAALATVTKAVRELCDRYECDDLDDLEDRCEAWDELDSYNGHLKWMDKHYPLDVPYFAGSEDVGCQVMRLSRKVMECEAKFTAAREEARKWEWVARHKFVCPLGEMNPGEPGSYIVERGVSDALLARYQPAAEEES